MVHVAIAGTGRVGQGVAYTLVFEKYIEKLTLVDTAPKVAEMVEEELNHAIAAHGFDMEIRSFDHSKYMQDADLIVIAAGLPRPQQMSPKMTRRDLANENAKVIRDIVTSSLDKNPRAWYFVITNPVDALSTLAYKLADGKRKVVGTGTNLETCRFRTILSRELDIPMRLIEAFVGGEHGQASVPLWSTVRIDSMMLDEYLNTQNKTLDKEKVVSYVRNISMDIISTLKGTRWGPAGSFLEIIRGIILNTGRLISYAIPRKFDEIPEPVHVTIPGRISRSFGFDLWNMLTREEQKDIVRAAKEIFETYKITKAAIDV
ncbi:MAG: NAD-binding protein [Candidatus Hodarchaeota archaeon]